MNKEMFINELNAAVEKFNLDRDGIKVVFGGASLIHGMRELTSDIDVEVTSDNWELLINAGLGDSITHIEGIGLFKACDIIPYGNIDFHFMGDAPNFTGCDYFDGFRMPTPLQLLKERIKLGRDKDLSDILMLREYWKSLSVEELTRMEAVYGISTSQRSC